MSSLCAKACQAAEKGKLRKLRKLLEEGLDIGSWAEEDEEPLLLCALRSHKPEIVNELLERGADVDEDLGGQGTAFTPLMYAALTGDLDMAKLLIEKGAEVNRVSDDGIFALDWAAEKGHTEVMQLLIDHGADLDLHGGDNRTALYSAGSREALEILVRNAQEINERSDRAAENGDYDAPHVETMEPEELGTVLEKWAELLGESSFPQAEEAIVFLLESGADPEESWQTVLSPPCWRIPNLDLSSRLVRAFLKAGLDADWALQEAKEAAESGELKLPRKLVRALAEAQQAS